jgi:hypothetical protein
MLTECVALGCFSKLAPKGYKTTERPEFIMCHYESKYWIDPQGTIHEVGLQTSHEEYADEHFRITLEEAFLRRYIRIQAFTGNYLLVDHIQELVAESQQAALQSFFESTYTTIVVQRSDGEQDFTSGDSNAAYRFAVAGR